MNEITGITVCANTKEIVVRAYNSVRSFHPKMPIIIVDGSREDDLCAIYVKGLASKKTTVVSLERNVGHGRGMCVGIDLVKTKYALIFDSDIEMLKTPVSQMLAMMDEDTFGVGTVCRTDFKGRSAHEADQVQMRYLHPFFHLINIANYKKHRPYIHNGAPCRCTMYDIHHKGLSKRIVKDFPGLEDYIKHYHRGTRGRKGLPNPKVYR